MYLSGTNFVNAVPTIAPRPVMKANAIITPTKTKKGNSYSAERAITANWVLSPNSINVIKEKEEKTAFRVSLVSTGASTFLEKIV